MIEAAQRPLALRLLSADEVEDWDERAAIMQYDGGMTEAEAERAALEDVMRRIAL